MANELIILTPALPRYPEWEPQPWISRSVYSSTFAPYFRVEVGPFSPPLDVAPGFRSLSVIAPYQDGLYWTVFFEPPWPGEIPWTAVMGGFTYDPKNPFGPLEQCRFGFGLSSMSDIANYNNAPLTVPPNSGFRYESYVLEDAGFSVSTVYETDLTPPPENDKRAEPFVITGDEGSSSSTTVRATREADEPGGVNFGDLRRVAVWWSWTAPADGRLHVDDVGTSWVGNTGFAEGDPATIIVAHMVIDDDGDEALLEVGYGGDGARSYPFSFDVLEGVTYKIAAHPANNALLLNLVLNWRLVRNDPEVPPTEAGWRVGSIGWGSGLGSPVTTY